jgi:hypothetical protein
MPAMPQPYRTPMDNPEYRRQFLERQIRQQQQQQQRSAEDPSYQILLEMQRRKLAGADRRKERPKRVCVMHKLNSI